MLKVIKVKRKIREVYLPHKSWIGRNEITFKEILHIIKMSIFIPLY